MKNANEIKKAICEEFEGKNNYGLRCHLFEAVDKGAHMPSVFKNCAINTQTHGGAKRICEMCEE